MQQIGIHTSNRRGIIHQSIAKRREERVYEDKENNSGKTDPPNPSRCDSKYENNKKREIPPVLTFKQETPGWRVEKDNKGNRAERGILIHCHPRNFSGIMPNSTNVASLVHFESPSQPSSSSNPILHFPERHYTCPMSFPRDIPVLPYNNILINTPQVRIIATLS